MDKSNQHGAMANGSITNYTVEGLLRVDLVFGIAYDSDIQKAKDLLLSLLMENPKVLKVPAPAVAVSELADRSVNFVVRPYCPAIAPVAGHEIKGSVT